MSIFTILLIVNPHAIPLDIGIAIKLIPVRISVIEFDVVVIKTNVLIVFNFVDIVLSY